MDISQIMVVDDSEADQYLTQMVIEEYDPKIEVISTYDGQEALETLAEMEAEPNLIILDINMPRMNGFEFLEAYSKLEYKAAVIAMLTSSEDGADKDRASKYDCVKAYLNKPVKGADLDLLRDL